MKKLKILISEIIIYGREYFTKCNCYNPSVYTKFKYINPKTGLWEYNTVCNYCGKIHYKSDSDK